MERGLRVRIVRESAGARGDSRHRYGRTGERPLPDCQVCEKPLDSIFDFDLSDPELGFLGLESTGRLRVLSCLGCDLPYAGQLYYRDSGDGVEVLRNDASTAFAAVWPTALPPCAVEVFPVPEAELPSSFQDEAAWREAVEFSEPQKHQLGGQPLWVQDELEVPCAQCRKRMRFLGQVASETWPAPDPRWEAGHMFGDMGMIYIHFCDSCRIYATGGDCY